MADKRATMNKYDSVVQGAAEKLLEDERLRSNLADDEADLLVNWAIQRFEGRVAEAPDEAAARQTAQAEMARVRPAMQKINDLLADGKTPKLSSAARALGLPLTGAAAMETPDRKAVIRNLTSLLTEAWRKK